MKALYSLQSTYTSDPYEPSETLVWGIFSSRTGPIAPFKAYLLTLADSLLARYQSVIIPSGTGYSSLLPAIHATHEAIANELATIIRDAAQTDDFADINASYIKLKARIEAAIESHRMEPHCVNKWESHTEEERELYNVYRSYRTFYFEYDAYRIGFRVDSFEIVEYQLDTFIAAAL